MTRSAFLPARHTLEERGADLYETPRCAPETLLRVEKLPHRIWEPAAGRGAITDVLRAAGHKVLASDLIDYGIPRQHSGRDFLRERLPIGCEAIVTNPPFKQAVAFARHAIAICPWVCMLLRLSFLESAKVRNDILDDGKLARVLVFKERLPRMHRDGWTGPQSSSSVAFAWFIWSWEHRGLATVHRISWRDK